MFLPLSEVDTHPFNSVTYSSSERNIKIRQSAFPFVIVLNVRQKRDHSKTGDLFCIEPFPLKNALGSMGATAWLSILQILGQSVVLQTTVALLGQAPVEDVLDVFNDEVYGDWIKSEEQIGVKMRLR